jgi:hypothetical protein
MCAEVDNLKKQTALNTSEIKTVGEAIVRLTAIIEMMQKTPATVTPAPVPTNSENTPVKPPFWDTETKKTAIKFSFILAVIVVLALVGTNLADAWGILKTVK